MPHTGFPGPNLILLNTFRPGQFKEAIEGIRSFVVGIIGVCGNPVWLMGTELQAS